VIRTSFILPLFIALLAGSGRVHARENPQTLLQSWIKEGSAVGFADLRYDNRDGGHSQIGLPQFPGLAALGPADGKDKVVPGPPPRVYPMPVVGNCSMAGGVLQGGSLGRRMLSMKQGSAFLLGQYVGANVYVYPEHRDHDPGLNGTPGYGDLFPVNSPCLVVTQGSSGSDRAVVSAFLRTMASFSPEVFAELRKRGLLAPTVQALFRKTYRPTVAAGEEGYFTGAAHPTAYDPALIDELAMMKAAHAMTPNTIPPMIHIEVVREDRAISGQDFFELSGADEVLADGPVCIARLFRSTKSFRKIEVSARRSFGVRANRLTYRWIVLRGDSRQVLIKTAEDGGSAEITIGYHSRAPISDEPGALHSNRVDVGVFVHDGTSWSSPAFVCSYSLANEDRIYGEGGRLREIFYQACAREPGFPGLDPLRYVPFLEHFERDLDPVFSPLLRSAVSASQAQQLVAVRQRILSDHDHVVAERAAVAAEDKQMRAELGLSARQLREAGPETKEELAKRHQVRAAAFEAADARRKERLAALTPVLEAMKTPLAEIDPVVRVAVTVLLEDPQLYFRDPVAIEAAAKRRPPNRMNQRLAQLASLRVIQKVGGGRYQIVARGGAIAANDVHHLRRLNLEILGRVAFPDFLRYPAADNYVDPTLTTRKAWRDVYEYDREGTPIGWTRLGPGMNLRMSANGEIAAASGGAPRPVTYPERDAAGLLQMVPAR